MSVPAQAVPAAAHAHRHPSQLHTFPPHSANENTFADELVELEDESQQRFKIFAVRHAAELTRASALLQRRYAWRGYSVQPLEERPVRRITLTAAQGRSTVATITAGLDGETGLYVEGVYPDRVRELRRSGRRLCEFTKFAVDESVRSQALLGAIFHVACMYVLEVHHCTDALIEVNPRHVRFYEQMLGFRRVADERIDPEVQAPAVLMQLDLQYCAGEIVRLAGAPNRGRRERSFYPHFFGPDVAGEVVSRLRTH